MKPVRFVVKYDNCCFFIENGGQKLSARTFADLKKKIAAYVEREYPDSPVEIRLFFDMNSIPRWFHQYQNHYFNTTLKIIPQKTI